MLIATSDGAAHETARTLCIGIASSTGLPAVVVPFIVEQRTLGHSVAGAGSLRPPLPFCKATADTLGARIRDAVTSESLRTRAAELAKCVAGEHGTETARNAIEREFG